MIVIEIGTEEKLFDKESRVYKRKKDYADLVDQNICFEFTKDKNVEKMQDGKFVIVPVCGKNKFWQIMNLIKLVSAEAGRVASGQEVIIYPQDPFEIGLLSFWIYKYFKFKKLSARFFVQMHTDISSAKFVDEGFRNFAQVKIANFVFRKADKIRVVSSRMQNYLIDVLGIKKEKITKLPIYTNSSEFSFDFNHQKKTDFLIMSRIEKVKNIELAIDSVKLLKIYNLKIIGAGSQKKYLQEKYSVENDEKNSFIIWADWTENPEQEYKEAKVFLLTSNYEGWGMTVVESVLSGTPVCMTDVGCAHDFIKNGINGFISESYKISEFSEILKKTISYTFDENLIKNSLDDLITKENFLKKLKDFLVL